MKRIISGVLVVIICQSQLGAQHFLTAGLQINSMVLDSEDLDQFKETYNMVNSPNLARLMSGMGLVNGLRGEIGYRSFGRMGRSLAIGYERSVGKDGVRYNNGETRNLKLTLSSLYIEGELGRTYEKFFVNGLITAFINRNISLESVYDGPPGEASKKMLNGTYTCKSSLSTDIGIVIGYFSEPIILSAKISYPVFSIGGSGVLKNSNDTFPNDFESYIYYDSYDGIVCDDIDGLKVLLSVVYAMQIGTEKD